MRLISKGGNRVDINAVQGKTWELVFTIKNEDGSIMNLTGAVLRGHIRKRPQDANAVAVWNCVITNPANGVAKAVLSANTTAGISQRSYLYDFELETIDGKVIELMRGVINVEYEVTR